MPKQSGTGPISNTTNKIVDIVPTKSDAVCDFSGDDRKTSFKKLVDKFPGQVSRVIAKSVAKTPVSKNAMISHASKSEAISVGKFDSIFNSINIQIHDGKLSNPNGPIQLLDKGMRKTNDEDSPEKTANIDQLKGKNIPFVCKKMYNAQSY